MFAGKESVIKRIELENWRSHEHTVLEFSKGTNVLVGIIGSGKSSVMNALCYALFGTFPDLQQRKLKLDDVIMNRPYEKKRARVLVHFTQGEEEYSVERVIERGRGGVENYLRKGDRLLEGPNSRRVTEKVSEVLGINYELFSKAVYSEQNNIEYFLEIPRGQRKQKLDELLGITKLEKARKNSARATRQLASRIAFLEAEKAPDEEEIRKKQAESEHLKSRIKELESRITKLKSALESAKTKKEEVENKRREHERLLRELEKLKGLAEALVKKAQAGARDLETVATDLESVRRQISLARESEKEKRALESLLSEKRGEASVLNKDLSRLEEELARLPDVSGVESELAEVSERILSLKSEVEASKTREREVEQKIRMLEGKDMCPLCGTMLTKEHADKIEAEKRKELQEIIADREKALHEINALSVREKELERLKEKASKRRYIQEQINQASQRLALKKQEAAELENKLKEITVPDLTPLLEKEQELLREKEAAEARLEYKRAVHSAENVKSRLEEIKYNPEEYEDAEKTLSRLVAERASLEQELAGERRLLEEKEKHLETLLEELEKARKAAEEKEACKKASARLSLLERVLAAGQDELRKEFVAETNLALQEVWQRIYPYKDYAGLKLDVEEGDYVLKLITKQNELVNVEGITSGGERSAASLALRIALSFVLARNLSWLVLDEPTHNLDKNTVKELATMLREKLPQIVDQVFIITHDEELEAAASGTLYVLDRNKEENEPTRAVKQY